MDADDNTVMQLQLVTFSVMCLYFTGMTLGCPHEDEFVWIFDLTFGVGGIAYVALALLKAYPYLQSPCRKRVCLGCTITPLCWLLTAIAALGLPPTFAPSLRHVVPLCLIRYWWLTSLASMLAVTYLDAHTIYED